MPIYEFQCDECDRPFDKLVRSSAIAEVTCPMCGSEMVHKKLSTFATRSSASGSSFSSGDYCAPGGT